MRVSPLGKYVPEGSVFYQKRLTVTRFHLGHLGMFLGSSNAYHTVSVIQHYKA